MITAAGAAGRALRVPMGWAYGPPFPRHPRPRECSYGKQAMVWERCGYQAAPLAPRAGHSGESGLSEGRLCTADPAS
ncbi:MAG: hypothetical protein JWR70_503 [Modestobacter sp.]|nr:hypothetical protein [Modestobacter sp.]